LELLHVFGVIFRGWLGNVGFLAFGTARSEKVVLQATGMSCSWLSYFNLIKMQVQNIGALCLL